MEKDDFVSTNKREKNYRQKKDSNNDKINWLNIGEIKIVKEKPHTN